MKIFTTSQFRELDEYTILKEPISSIDLMERASLCFVETFRTNVSKSKHIFVFAGPGNNGGDALAIARLLVEKGYKVHSFLFNPKDNLSPDCNANKAKILSLENIQFTEITNAFSPPQIEEGDVIIDGLFGTGLNHPLTGGFASVVHFINQTKATVYSIDMPSGLFGEDNTNNTRETIVRADITLSCQGPKLAFFLPDCAEFVGKWDILDVQLHPDALADTETSYHITKASEVMPLIKTRSLFSHKGTFGHALLVAGSKGKMGAAVLSAKACLKSGAGALTCHIPGCGNDILQTAFPEAMTQSDVENDYIIEISKPELFDAIGVGPGIGQHAETSLALQSLFHQYKKPLIIDADALNLIAQNEFLLKLIPAQSILTPHPKELDRLAGHSSSSYQRLQKALDLAAQINCYIILKGAYSAIITPEKECFFNPTGNPGMATAGSGDVLTGILLGLLSQGYSPFETSTIGPYLHGMAGDLALETESEQSMISSNIIEKIGDAWKELSY